ncbi:MAG: FUSC family protein [Rothia sp. (in: high G+C Gram-positive bacteria)]|uniref:FUSC family protein n=1 Tax=Rothia sp. (in: high G+C Gram-positive bacteria) TaxID=1885016 RepID=UPI0026DF444A|nr:FUSC family protein [Rothia sp. (in: high G+C Gram-positive bacteria)]MDO5750554.1 FUSC family protein [Rothia sp. (in: high G+C Gram-positive bacteria)]
MPQRIDFTPFLTIAPMRREYIPAARVALSLAIPLSVLVALGQIQLTFFAIFGAFTAIYGRHELPALRFKHQLQIGILQIICVALGLWMSAIDMNSWLKVTICALVGGVGGIISIYLDLFPPGPLFYIFAIAPVAFLPYNHEPWLSLGATGFAVFCALFTGWLGTLVGEGTNEAAVPPRPHHGLSTSEILAQGAIFAVAMFAAGAWGELSGVQNNYWAMTSAAAIMLGITARMTVLRSIHRVYGTIAGIVVSAFFVSMSPSPWHVVVLVVVSQFYAELYIKRHYGIGVFFVTPVALLMIYLVFPTDASVLMTARIWETIIGAIVAVVAVYLVPNPEYRGQDTQAIPVLRLTRDLRRARAHAAAEQRAAEGKPGAQIRGSVSIDTGAKE